MLEKLIEHILGRAARMLQAGDVEYDEIVANLTVLKETSAFGQLSLPGYLLLLLSVMYFNNPPVSFPITQSHLAS